MRVSAIGLVLLVCAVVLISGVSAQNVDKNAGYSVTPVGNLVLPQTMHPMTAGTITQGQSNWYYYVISSGKTSMITDLNWGDTSDSIALTIFAPDGTLGPYYDSSDGVIDGRINLAISRTTGLAPGTWNFLVYGYHVTGSQSYNFVIY